MSGTNWQLTWSGGRTELNELFLNKFELNLHHSDTTPQTGKQAQPAKHTIPPPRHNMLTWNISFSYLRGTCTYQWFSYLTGTLHGIPKHTPNAALSGGPIKWIVELKWVKLLLKLPTSLKFEAPIKCTERIFQINWWLGTELCWTDVKPSFWTLWAQNDHSSRCALKPQ